MADKRPKLPKGTLMIDDPKAKPEAVTVVVGSDKQPATPQHGGHNKHVPTPQNQAIVKMMVAAGRPQDEIAIAIKIGETTLREHYRTELDEGMADANRMVLGKLFGKINDGEMAAILFYCKTRMGMKEGVAIDHSFPNGIPASDAPVTDERTKQLIKEVLDEF